jgi:catechol 2,3-dioxygenase-like lactoylglutathione lyase family enzyme
MDWKLEVVIAPVSDVERAREFYADKLGFTVDTDFAPNEHFRVIQVTPPGSACSIVFGTGLGGGVSPGSLKGAQLVVEDIEQALALLDEKGIENTGPVHFADGVQTAGLDPNRADYGTFVYFDDPDGNTWAVQEIKNHVR